MNSNQNRGKYTGDISSDHGSTAAETATSRRPYEQEGYNLMAAAFEVFNEMGNGYLEEVYQECLEQELETRRIPFASKPELTVHYKGQPLKKKYFPDLTVFGEVVVEIKAAKQLAPENEAQLLNYLKATRKKVGYLINFGSPDKLEWKRMLWTAGKTGLNH